MNARVQTYLTEQLAFTGLAILHYETAFRMRPDLWTSLTSAREDLTDAGPKLTSFIEERAGARLFEVLGVQLAALGKVINLRGV